MRLVRRLDLSLRRSSQGLKKLWRFDERLAEAKEKRIMANKTHRGTGDKACVARHRGNTSKASKDSLERSYERKTRAAAKAAIRKAIQDS